VKPRQIFIFSASVSIAWSVTMALIVTAVAYFNPANPLIVFAAGYICAGHAEHAYNEIIASWREIYFRRSHHESYKRSGTD
jgi:hypothetical protein